MHKLLSLGGIYLQSQHNLLHTCTQIRNERIIYNYYVRLAEAQSSLATILEIVIRS